MMMKYVLNSIVAIVLIGGSSSSLAASWQFPYNGNTRQSSAALKAVPTFHNIGLYWKASGSDSQEAFVRYRAIGGEWKQALSLWYDSRANWGPAQHNREYRGSIVNLMPNTSYEVEVLNGSTGETARTTIRTWSENFPIAKTVRVDSSNKTLVLNESGSPNGYILYQGPATIDVNNGQDYNVDVNASYVIIRNLTLKDARQHSVNIRDSRHHVVIEGNDISGWGRLAKDGRFSCNRDSGVFAAGGAIANVVIQNNKIHHPRGDANRAFDGRTRAIENGCFGAEVVNQPNGSVYQHTQGALGIGFFDTAGNNVVRYNEIVSDEGHKFAYGISGATNRSFVGSPGEDSDIYGNIVTNAAGNAIEAEGGGMNVRVFKNFIDGQGEDSIGLSSVSLGPLYLFRNVTYRNQPSTKSTDSCQGTMIKNQSTQPSGSLWGGGRLYVFNNTAYKTSSSDCVGIGLSGVTSQILNVVSRNNIFDVSRRSIEEYDPVSGAYVKRSDFDYDLLSSNLDPQLSSTGQEQHGIVGRPQYGGSSGKYSLRAASPGHDDGAMIPNFTEEFRGAGPDIGAQEDGLAPLRFGTRSIVASGDGGVSANDSPPAPPVLIDVSD